MAYTNWFTHLYGWSDEDSYPASNAIRKVSEVLTRAFRPDEVSSRKQGSRDVSYIENTTCIDRLNEAFTPLGWSYDCSNVVWQPAPEGQTSRQIAVYGKLTIHLPWGDVEKGQWGSRTVMATASDTKMDYGDDLKSAGSDALKKCASLCGIYNYGYRKGRSHADPEASAVLQELLALFPEKKLTKQQFLDFCSGVTRKTVLSAADLSLTQAQACLALLGEKTAPSILQMAGGVPE